MPPPPPTLISLPFELQRLILSYVTPLPTPLTRTNPQAIRIRYDSLLATSYVTPLWRSISRELLWQVVFLRDRVSALLALVELERCKREWDLEREAWESARTDGAAERESAFPLPKMKHLEVIGTGPLNHQLLGEAVKDLIRWSGGHLESLRLEKIFGLDLMVLKDEALGELKRLDLCTSFAFTDEFVAGLDLVPIVEPAPTSTGSESIETTSTLDLTTIASTPYSLHFVSKPLPFSLRSLKIFRDSALPLPPSLFSTLLESTTSLTELELNLPHQDFPPTLLSSLPVAAGRIRRVRLITTTPLTPAMLAPLNAFEELTILEYSGPSPLSDLLFALPPTTRLSAITLVRSIPLRTEQDGREVIAELRKCLEAEAVRKLKMWFVSYVPLQVGVVVPGEEVVRGLDDVSGMDEFREECAARRILLSID